MYIQRRGGGEESNLPIRLLLHSPPLSASALELVIHSMKERSRPPIQIWMSPRYYRQRTTVVHYLLIMQSGDGCRRVRAFGHIRLHWHLQTHVSTIHTVSYSHSRDTILFHVTIFSQTVDCTAPRFKNSSHGVEGERCWVSFLFAQSLKRQHIDILTVKDADLR